MFDSIVFFVVGDQIYYIIVNEGDVCNCFFDDDFLFFFFDGEGDIFIEEVWIKDLVLDFIVFFNVVELQVDFVIGCLMVIIKLGDIDGDGDFDEFYVYGFCFFFIWNSSGNLVYDSGEDFECIIVEVIFDFFNVSNDNNDLDNCSDNKGFELEGVIVGIIDGCIYVFVGLECIGGVMVYDVIIF